MSFNFTNFQENHFDLCAEFQFTLVHEFKPGHFLHTLYNTVYTIMLNQFNGLIIDQIKGHLRDLQKRNNLLIRSSPYIIS